MPASPSLNLRGYVERTKSGYTVSRRFMKKTLKIRKELRFAEDVAVNRGVDVKVCSTVVEAERWLSR